MAPAQPKQRQRFAAGHIRGRVPPALQARFLGPPHPTARFRQKHEAYQPRQGAVLVTQRVRSGGAFPWEWRAFSVVSFQALNERPGGRLSRILLAPTFFCSAETASEN
eukprot:1351883-Rhodomonas_salina.1